MTRTSLLPLRAIVLSLLFHPMLAAFSFADILKGFEARQRGDFETAIKEFKSSADAGDEKAILFLGNAYEDLLRETFKRQGDTKTVAQSAIAVLKPFASRGDREAQYWLAQIYGFESNDEEKFFWLGQAAKQEHGPAQWALGNMYKAGKDWYAVKSFRVGPDYYEARKWYEKAANNGEDVAMEDLGHLYASGRGVARDYAIAIKWFEAAIRDGNLGALLALGSLYELGKGVPRDKKTAEDLYSKSLSRGYFFGIRLAKLRADAAKGDTNAEYELGQSWFGTSGLVEDIDEALRLINKAADKFHTRAILTLGFMYKQGWKVPQDYVTAHKWYNIGASLGDDKAKYERDDLAKKMTPPQLADAQKLAREWMESRAKR
jgi:TPR repeat protein